MKSKFLQQIILHSLLFKTLPLHSSAVTQQAPKAGSSPLCTCRDHAERLLPAYSVKKASKQVAVGRPNPVHLSDLSSHALTVCEASVSDWNFPAVSLEPDFYLSRWRVFETDDGLKRLVGYDSANQGRVSCAVVTFNPQTMQVQSSDCLTYRLLGEPGSFWDVIDTWDIWHHTITQGQGGCVKDVTDEMRQPIGDDDASLPKKS